MSLRAIDFHVHLPTPDWLDGSMAGYLEAAEAYFRSSVTRQSLAELAAFYRGLEVKAVLLAWDAETATERARDGASRAGSAGAKVAREPCGRRPIARRERMPGQPGRDERTRPTSNQLVVPRPVRPLDERACCFSRTDR